MKAKQNKMNNVCLTVRFTVQDLKRLTKQADVENMKRASFARKVILDYLDDKDK